jgi:phage pi2 protein 07
LNTWEHEKGADFGFDRGIKNIIFDEALTKGGKYLPDEWSIFQNVISTLVRDRWEFDTKIFLLANPLSKWASPYTRNMGITKKMYDRPGITEIKYPDEKGEVAMSAVFAYIGELSEVAENANKVHNTFFAFTHSKGKAKSITHGFWEMDDSARLPSGVYADSEKLRTIYVIFEEEKLGIDIMRYEESGKYYLLIYPVSDIRKNTYFMILSPCLDKYAIVGSDDDHPIVQLLFSLQNTGLVFYSDDSTADAWHGFLLERHKYKI